MYDNNTINNKDILTLEEASRLFQVSTKTLLKLLREEDLPARKVGREWRFSREALLKWIADGNSRNYATVEDDNKAYFEQVAPIYDELRKGCYGDALKEILLSRFKPQSHFEVADIGTGTGYLAKGLALHAKKVWAIDSSPAMLDVVKQDLQKLDLTNVSVIEGDALDLPLKTRTQDMVFANLLLHHLLEPEQALKEMFRVLKPDGILIITDIDSHQHSWLKTEKSDIWLGFEESTVQNWLESAGFSKIEIQNLGCNCRTSSNNGNPVEIPMFIAVGTKS